MTESNHYFDFNATTPLDPMVQEKIPLWISLWGNPSSIHQHGREPKKLLRQSRRNLAKHFDCHPLELVFTSGGTESNNLAIKGFCQEFKKNRSKILMGAIEHPSVLKQIPSLQSMGFEVILIPVKSNGEYDLSFYRDQLNEQVALVSVMLANNEVGVIAPLKKMIKQAHSVGAFFHSDMVQALGKIPLNLKTLDVDIASFSSHKVYALKGSGVLYVKRGTPLGPLIDGGGQERGRRAGTENIPAIASFAFMVNQLNPQSFIETVTPLRDEMEKRLLKTFPNIKILCAGQQRLANTSCFVIPEISGESLLIGLDVRGFSVSAGSACSSGSPEPSPVLQSMGLTGEEAQSSLRISLGKDTKKKEVLRLVEAIKDVIKHLQNLNQQEQEGESHESNL